MSWPQQWRKRMHVSKQCSLQKRLVFVESRFVPRKANAAAHGLAQEGKRFETVRYWIEEAPVRVEKLVTEGECRGEEMVDLWSKVEIKKKLQSPWSVKSAIGKQSGL
ncbi:hypothetical protein Goshw_017062 [Gossypium schwendimanii]|uniref:RNase H type-1 domain-containing protein n=1 Tax=Gossypium schwendimanii TaxID=34291 RepID=A0A7J9MIT7_GOSSC|nr:hypothetical protein [Gossypium schwendimanii]